MKLTHKIVGLAAAAALVAGAGLAAAPAAISAAPVKKATGTTLISFKGSYKALYSQITAVSPAKISGNKLTFPIVDVTKNVIKHDGAMNMLGLEAQKPVITLGKNKTGTVALYIPLAATEAVLFEIKQLNNNGTFREGHLHLTSDQELVDTLNTVLNLSLKPGADLGKIRITVK
ncbi:MAG: hypothetical protein ACKOT0_03680 [bacterium]